jgi:hypothetical protein
VPGGLAFLEDSLLEVELPPPLPRRSLPARLLRLLLALALLAGAGLAGARWAAEQDVRDVLASSTSTYARVLDLAGAARDPVALASAAALAPRGAERLQADLSALTDEPGERRAAVAALVTAEREVLLALAPLERLPDGPLRVWGTTAARLAEAVEAEVRARAGLRRVDDGAADALPDSASALRRVQATMGAALVDDVQRTAGELLDDLEAATRTAELREVAARAPGQRAAVAAAQRGLAGGGGAGVLADFGGALAAVEELTALTPGDTSAWPGARGRLQQALQAVADADDSLEAGSVRARTPLVLAALDGLVRRAGQAHAAWQPVHDAAVAQQAADRAVLQRYGEQVRAGATEWAQVRGGAEALLAGAPTTGAAAAELDRLAAAADRVAAVLAGRPPAGVEQAHAGLVDATRALRAALTGAYDALRRDPCRDCPAPATASWAGLRRAAPAARAWDDALAAWETAVTDADAAIGARPLPPAPDA